MTRIGNLLEILNEVLFRTLILGSNLTFFISIERLVVVFMLPKFPHVVSIDT